MITLLKDDLDFYLKDWKDNQNATEAQRDRWPQDRKIPRPLLGNDLEESLRLLVEDGGDGGTVGSVTSSTARHFFYDGSSHHSFPPDRDLIRLGKFLHLDLISTLAMVLKVQWEIYFSKKKDWTKDQDGRDLFEILENDIDDAKKYSLDFNAGENERPGAAELFNLFEETGEIATKADYDQNSFESLIHQMINEHMHLTAPISPEFRVFIERQEKEVSLLKQAPDALAESFWIKKCCYHQYENDVGRLLLNREDKRLENANTRNKWLAVFGDLFLPLTEAESKYYAFLRRVQLLNELGPDITPEELFKIEAEQLKNEKQRLQKLKEEYAFAQLPDAEGISGTAEQISNYETEALKVLRQIWFLTHDDVINAEQFTDLQKKQLRGYFDQVMKIRNSEKGLWKRSLGVLLDILTSVKSIWENMGLEVRAESIISGDTIQDQIDWIENRIIRLDRQIKDLRAEILDMINDKDIKEKRASMSSPEQIEKIKEQMKNRLEEFEQKIATLKQSIHKQFLFEEIN